MMTTPTKPPLFFLSIILLMTGCSREAVNSSQSSAPNAAAIQTAQKQGPPVTLPVLYVLLANEQFRTDLKTKLALTDEQITELRKVSNLSNAPGTPDAATQDAQPAIRKIVGDKADPLLALARDYQKQAGPDFEAAVKQASLTMLPGPNAIPPDTRIVVNIPAFRMDVFRSGSLLKSYRIGIGYQQFPLPTGFRKAEMIIFNPSWKQPNESWASSPGAVVPAGAPGNPLGPIKVPIGGANLIHGGKDRAKIGTFASHGCVGLTNE